MSAWPHKYPRGWMWKSPNPHSKIYWKAFPKHTLSLAYSLCHVFCIGSQEFWSLSQGSWGTRQDTHWTWCQSITGHKHAHTHSYTMSNLETPLILIYMSLDLNYGKKAEYLEETHLARGAFPEQWRNILSSSFRTVCLSEYLSFQMQQCAFFFQSYVIFIMLNRK